MTRLALVLVAALAAAGCGGDGREKARMNPKTVCLGAIRVYADSFERGAIDDVLKVGLEAEGRVKNDEVGVFPRTGPRELQVILMRRIDGEWKVASMSLAPGRPEPTATADSQ